MVHFGGFELDKVHRFTLKLVNSGTVPARYVVTPPSTPFFTILCTKNEVFAPGIQQSVEIEFVPTEYRYYFDTITVQIESGETLTVPLHAYPVLAEISVPSAFDFGACPIQVPVAKAFPIKCDVPIEFEFLVRMVNSHPAFAVTPPSGTIPARGEARVTVTYTPTDYTTASCVFEVLVSQYNAKPIRCTVLGSCSPGALTNALTRHVPPTPPSHPSGLGSTASRPQERSLNGKQSSLQTSRPPPAAVTAAATTARPQESAMREVDGVLVPRQLRGMAAINYVLNQTTAPQQGPAARLVGPNYRKTHTALQRAFLQDVRKASSKLPGKGEAELSHEARRAILATRREAEEQYFIAKSVGPAAEAAALARTQTLMEPDARLVRSADSNKNVTLEPTFTQRTQLSFNARMFAFQRFVQAGRRVIVQARLRQRLRQLLRHCRQDSDAADGATTAALSIQPPANLEPSLELPVYVSATMPHHAPRQPLSVPLPSVPDPQQPFAELMVPEYYRTQGYTTYSVQQAVYLPTEMERPLRRRQDPLPAPPRVEQRSASGRSTVARKSALTAQDSVQNIQVTQTETETVPEAPAVAAGADVPLTHPPQLAAPSLPACGLNPLPGVIAVMQPLALGETDDGHLLHPFVDITVPHARLLSTTLVADVVPEPLCMAAEAMSMAVTLGAPPLARFWVPRCTDPFADTLPLECPPLLERQPAEDAAVNAAAPPPVPSIESIFYLPRADGAAGLEQAASGAATVGISITEREGRLATGGAAAAAAAAATVAAPASSNFASDTTLYLREERERLCSLAAEQTDTLALRVAEREKRALHPAPVSMARVKSAEPASSRA